jgi:transposase
MGSPTWVKMFRYFNEHNEDFMKHYHKRSNIESVWSMIKARFGDHLKSRKEESQDNEIILKVLCHNLCVLVQEIFMRNIDINFSVQAENRDTRTRT